MVVSLIKKLILLITARYANNNVAYEPHKLAFGAFIALREPHRNYEGLIIIMSNLI